MSHTINALYFARHGQAIGDKSPVSGFSRLVEGLPEGQDGTVAWRLEGRRDAQGRLFLDVRAEGTIVLQCQRCLQPMAWPMDVHNALRLLASRSEIEAMDAREARGEAGDEEYILAPESLDPLELVEDELILVLPYVPRHEVCPGQSGTGRDADPDRPSPFAVLGRLGKN